jgi:Fe-S cluster assembly protein SufD
MQAFSADEARSFGAPDPSTRAAAADRAAVAPWPTTGDEIWRYSRIEELDLAGYRPASASTTVVGGSECLVPLADITHVPGVIDGDAPDLFAELNAAFMTPVVLRVKPGHHVVEPVVITHVISGDGVAVFPRLVIEAGEDSEIVVIERFVAGDGEASGATFVAPVLQVRAEQAARVSYLGVNELDDSAWQIGHQQAVGERDSTITLGTVALGGHYARVRTEARVAGAGATTRQIALYFAGGDQMHDFRTIQDHDAPHTNSDLLFKGAVQDRARSVYTGVIKIRPHARGTAAFQTNRNLTLGEQAWAESVPNLEIETNDVKCSHASTVGPIDPEHRFYLESRGIPSAVADRLVVLGFFDEVLQQLPTGPELAAELRSRVSAKLDLDRSLTGVA